MSTYTLSHLTNEALLRDLAALVARDRTTTAELLAHIAEVDARRVYLPAAHPSMFSYCVHELHLSEDAAFKRIQAARAARQFPAIFAAVAEGRLHLSAVNLLAPHLTAETADWLLAAAEHKTKAEIELLLAQHFPKPDVATRLEAVAPPSPTLPISQHTDGDAMRPQEQLAPGQVEAPPLRDKLSPLSPERFLLRVTVDQDISDMLGYAQALLGHQIPAGDVAEVLRRSLRAFIRTLENRKFAATAKPRASRGPSTDPRHVPAHVKRAVWERDGGQCTFVSDAGRRCPCRRMLEFDHVDEVARGGRATIENLRLRCRAHNQYAAECTFGTEFMEHKRSEARRAAATRSQVQPSAEPGAQAATMDAQTEAAARDQARAVAQTIETNEAQRLDDQDVVPWLRQLGFRVDEARRAAEFCSSIPDASLEERVRVALSYLRPRVPSRRGERPRTAA